MNEIKNIHEWKSDKDGQKTTDSRIKVVVAMNEAVKKFRWDHKDGSQDWNQTLMTIINMANQEFNGTGILCSCEVNAIISSLMYFEPSSDAQPTNLGDFYISGTLNQFVVTVDPYLPAPILLIIKNDFFTAENPECVIILVDNLKLWKIIEL